MVKAINKLPSDRRDLMMKTMIEILSELPEGERRNMMHSMDNVIFASTGPAQIVHQFAEKHNPRHEVEDARRGPRAIFRRYGIPRWPMKLVYPVMTKALYDSAADADIPFFHILFSGYLWHYIIGMTFGIAHTLLFGAGTWLTILGFGVFIWAVMMAVMPSMMPMIKLPYPKFMVVPLIAHLAFAISLGLILMNLISPQLSASSIFSLLLEVSKH
jgi:type IV secretory pathway TrbD component